VLLLAATMQFCASEGDQDEDDICVHGG